MKLSRDRRARINFWLADTQFGLALYLQEHRHAKIGGWLEDVQTNLIEDPGKVLMCRLFGHDPERDHCGMPEHDCCLWCQKLMPFQAPGRAA